MIKGGRGYVKYLYCPRPKPCRAITIRLLKRCSSGYMAAIDFASRAEIRFGTRAHPSVFMEVAIFCQSRLSMPDRTVLETLSGGAFVTLEVFAIAIGCTSSPLGRVAAVRGPTAIPSILQRSLWFATYTFQDLHPSETESRLARSFVRKPCQPVVRWWVAKCVCAYSVSVYLSIDHLQTAQIILYNTWCEGNAKSTVDAGAKALASSMGSSIE